MMPVLLLLTLLQGDANSHDDLAIVVAVVIVAVAAVVVCDADSDTYKPIQTWNVVMYAGLGYISVSWIVNGIR